ncbi:hypothetical protein [Actinophytocola oryzae]|uniref:Uncharacterized protein n=1 Tax=Actinophytocola oryzae TaxID=502181 RepID=A0A4R7W438_9PSEU|nr:hypothetical protein [Actinophytocola oryzae]TDV56387.1 hypothetical protein CLV71_102454 [Actinophytocola oryzae]
MSDTFRKIIENVLPSVIEKRLSRGALYVTFWTVTGVLSLWFLMSGLVYGTLVMGGPLLLLAATRHQGLGRVHPLLLAFAAVMSFVPAFFLGRYQASEETPGGLVLVGFLVFLIWVTAYPTMLDKLDERFQLSAYPPDARNRTLPAEVRDQCAMYRVLLVRLWMAAMAMFAVDSTIVALLCLVALVVRRRWLAAVAGIACLLEAVVSIGFSGLSLTFEPLDVLAGVLAALQWYEAVKNPLWERQAHAGRW